MNFAKSLYALLINKFNEKFTNYDGTFNVKFLISYIFSKSVFNLPIKVIRKIKYSLLSKKKSSSLNILFGMEFSAPYNDKINYTQYPNPKVSIIIPVYNQVQFTIDCLISLYKNISDQYSFEIIVVNDKSSDNTIERIKAQFSGVTIISNEINQGFVRSCNAGASISRGEFLCFLNNDTYIQSEWLEVLVDTIQNDLSIGLVGSMLLYPNGVLQEAGGIVWNNGEGWNYGRNENRFNTRYNYNREVDYISGASILLRKSDFNFLGGFDELFVPAYYEDTDLCFNIRHKLNKKVVYCPYSKVIHFEGITSGTSLNTGVKKHQVINRQKFLQKWGSVLEEFYFLNNPENIDKSILKYNTKHILIIDSYVPCYNKESGSNRLFQIIKIIKGLNYKVTFLPDNEKAEEPYTKELQQMGVEVFYRNKYYRESFNTQLCEIIETVDIAWVCRPELFQKYYPKLSKNNRIKLIYDTIDLHFLRLKRETELYPKKKNDWKAIQAIEQEAAHKSHYTLAISPVDASILKSLDANNVVVVPNIHTIQYEEIDLDRDFEKRSGLLFIGGYNHTPNIDAVEWLVKSIMPLVWAKIPGMNVTLLGSNPNEGVKKLAASNIDVPGFIDNVTPYFNSHKVFVAPLRYGAGMKGKIGQSLEYGLPIVSTNIGIEGMDMEDEANVLIANNEIDFANSIIKLYTDKYLWNKIRLGSAKVLEPYTVNEIQKVIEKILECD
jgi:GT2 family glycosyltransferase